MQILEAKGGEFSVTDALIVAGLKIVSEQALAKVPFVGNGTLRSGLIKGVGAIALTTMTKNKWARYEGTALMVDAGEDIVGALLGKYLGNGSTSSQRQIGTSNQGAGVNSVI